MTSRPVVYYHIDDMLLTCLSSCRHQHQVTLWDDMKKAARSADGTLHHLGDQLRNRYHHHGSHSQLPEMRVELGEEPNGEQDIKKQPEENGDGNAKQTGECVMVMVGVVTWCVSQVLVTI